jgi:hypothetical protein
VLIIPAFFRINPDVFIILCGKILLRVFQIFI